MEGFKVLQSRQSATSEDDVFSDGGGLRNESDDDGETDDADSFIDLVFKSPDHVAVIRGDGEAKKKEYRSLESPRDVLLSKSGFSNPKDLPPIDLLRLTPKFKVFFALNFGKQSKCEKTFSDGDLISKSNKFEQNSRFSVKCRVEEKAEESIVTGNNSLRSHLLKERSAYEALSEKTCAVPKYLKLIKPLYLKVCKRRNEKAKLTEFLTPLHPWATAPVKLLPIKFSQSSRASSPKVTVKHLGKSRSVSAATDVPIRPGCRRDDSLLEQHDGIQGAVFYCKKSYNSSSEDISQLIREESGYQIEERHSCVEPIRCSI